MNILTTILLAGAAALSFWLVGVTRTIAVRKNLLDVPNERSSHLVATPRGGGIAIVAAFMVVVFGLCAMGLVSARVATVFVICGTAVAVVGYLDDRHRLGAGSRFLVHISAACVFIGVVGGYPVGQMARWGMGLLWSSAAFSGLVLVWATNLFNFMDGIDGLAASEVIFMSVAAGILNLVCGGEVGMSCICAGVASASFGFLLWNWPPARIFMGDVGSSFLGFVVAACCMAASQHGRLPVETLPILGGYFVVDASVTLLRRMFQGDRWLEPHRTHAYQHLALQQGHRFVTLLVAAINVFWLLPWAVFTVLHPNYARLCLGAALLPLVIFSISAGAGRRDVAMNSD